MADHQNSTRGPHRWAPGQSGNRAGRPRGQSVSAELRRIADPEKIASYIYGVATDPTASAKDRQWAVGVILDRMEGKPTTFTEMRLQAVNASLLPENFRELDEAQRARVLDEIRERALGAGAAINSTEETP